MRVDRRDQLSGEVIEAAITVHRALGPGLLESVYQHCLVLELVKRAIPFESQRSVPVRYDGALLDLEFRIDLLVANELVVELKCVERIAPIHLSQVITYMRLSGRRRALLINFNVRRLIDGVLRLAL